MKSSIEKIASASKITLPMVIPQDETQKEKILEKYKIQSDMKNILIVSKGNEVQFVDFDVTEDGFSAISDAVRELFE